MTASKPHTIFGTDVYTVKDRPLTGTLIIGLYSGSMEFKLTRKNAKALIEQLQDFLAPTSAELQRVISDSTGPDGEIYGHRE